MTVRETYDDMVRRVVGPRLEAADFRRPRNAFRRPWQGGWHIVDFQASQFGSSEAVKFTVNVALAYEPVRGSSEQWDARTPPPAHKPHVSERIGSLAAVEGDLWWHLGAGADVQQIAADVSAKLADRAIPWLEANATLEDSLRAAAGPYGLRSYQRARLAKLATDAGNRSLGAALIAAP